MIELVNQESGHYPTLGKEEFIPKEALSTEQQHAVKFILKSRDFAVCLQGAAGTGKSDTLKEIERGLMEAGRGVIAIAPTQTAVRELTQRGLDQAMTVERLLVDSQAQHEATGKAWIVDE